MSNARLSFSESGSGALGLELSGSWKLADELPSMDDVRIRLKSGVGVKSIAFDTGEVSAWDSGVGELYHRHRRCLTGRGS